MGTEDQKSSNLPDVPWEAGHDWGNFCTVGVCSLIHAYFFKTNPHIYHIGSELFCRLQFSMKNGWKTGACLYEEVAIHSWINIKFPFRSIGGQSCNDQVGSF